MALSLGLWQHTLASSHSHAPRLVLCASLSLTQCESPATSLFVLSFRSDVLYMQFTYHWAFNLNRWRETNETKLASIQTISTDLPCCFFPSLPSVCDSFSFSTVRLLWLNACCHFPSHLLFGSFFYPQLFVPWGWKVPWSPSQTASQSESRAVYRSWSAFPSVSGGGRHKNYLHTLKWSQRSKRRMRRGRAKNEKVVDDVKLVQTVSNDSREFGSFINSKRQNEMWQLLEKLLAVTGVENQEWKDATNKLNEVFYDVNE